MSIFSYINELRWWLWCVNVSAVCDVRSLTDFVIFWFDSVGDILFKYCTCHEKRHVPETFRPPKESLKWMRFQYIEYNQILWNCLKKNNNDNCVFYNSVIRPTVVIQSTLWLTMSHLATPLLVRSLFQRICFVCHVHNINIFLAEGWTVAVICCLLTKFSGWEMNVNFI